MEDERKKEESCQDIKLAMLSSNKRGKSSWLLWGLILLYLYRYVHITTNIPPSATRVVVEERCSGGGGHFVCLFIWLYQILSFLQKILLLKALALH